MKELTMVDLSVYTNHRMGDVYYNIDMHCCTTSVVNFIVLLTYYV